MIKPPYKKSEVRPEYAAGLWSNAVGRPAEQHPEYERAVKTAERAGWNPWWIRSVSDVTAVMHDCWMDEAAGRKVADFFPRVLRHHKGAWAGKRFDLIDWQAYDLTIPLFGWQRPDGGRRFSKAGVWTPKKNGKSEWCAGCGLYMLEGDREPGAEVYVAASALRQSNIIHGVAQKMASRSPSLAKRLRVYHSTSRIVATDGVFAALSSEAGVQEGLDWSCLLFDELHVADWKLFAALIEGGIARAGSALGLTISTSGEFDPLSIGWDQWELGGKVSRGELDDWSYFSLRYCADDEDNINDPVVWRRANPSMGIIFSEDDFRDSWKKARNSAKALADFRRYRLNQWVRSVHTWVNTTRWIQSARTVETDALRGVQCYGGLDLSSVSDMTAFGLLFDRPGEKPFWKCWFWLPEENIDDLAVEAQAPYQQWASDGHLFLTPGEVIDQNAVLEFIRKKLEEYDVKEIAFDPYKATQITTTLEEADGVTMVKFSQGSEKMSPAIRDMERRIKGGEIEHDGNPIMNWMLSNAETIETSQGNVRLMKTVKRKRKKIDGVVALVMAGDCQARAALSAPKRSRYEDEDAEILTFNMFGG